MRWLTLKCVCHYCFFFSSRRRHTRFDCDWSSDVCSSDLCVSASRSWLCRFLGGKTQIGGAQSQLLLADTQARERKRGINARSEERRVRKECRSRWSRYN